jgi:hypothetical protein
LTHEAPSGTVRESRTNVREARMPVHTDTVQHIAELLTELDPATRLVTAETIRTHVCGPAAHGAVQELREAPGAWSWSEVGALLGITKQSAHERWGS